MTKPLVTKDLQRERKGMVLEKITHPFAHLIGCVHQRCEEINTLFITFFLDAVIE